MNECRMGFCVLHLPRRVSGWNAYFTTAQSTTAHHKPITKLTDGPGKRGGGHTGSWDRVWRAKRRNQRDTFLTAVWYTWASKKRYNTVCEGRREGRDTEDLSWGRSIQLQLWQSALPSLPQPGTDHHRRDKLMRPIELSGHRGQGTAIKMDQDRY